MQKKNFSLLCITILVLLSCVILSCFVERTTAQTPRAELAIIDHSYTLTNRTTRGRVVASWYNISVTLQNSGEIASYLTRVNLDDEDMPIPLTKTVIIEPNETITLYYEWATGLYKNQNITFSFAPDSINIQKDNFNSGSSVMFLEVVDETTTSTPGFTIFLVLIGFIVVAAFKRYQ